MMLWLVATPRRAVSSNMALRKCRVWFLNKDHTPALLWYGPCGAAPRRRGTSAWGFLHSLDQVSLPRDIFALCFSYMTCPGPSFISMSPFQADSSDSELDPVLPLSFDMCSPSYNTVKGRGQESWVIWRSQLSSMEKVVCFIFSWKHPSKFYQPMKPTPQCIDFATLPTNLCLWTSFSLAHRCPATLAGGSIPWLFIFQRGDISARIWINLSNMKPL